MKRLFLLLFLIAAAPSYACVQTFLLDPSEAFADQRVEAVLSGVCGSSAVPFQPLVRIDGTTVTIDFAQASSGLTVLTPWGERVRLPRLFAGEYTVVVRIMGEEVSRKPLAVRDRPFRVLPSFGEPGEKVIVEGMPIDVVCPLIHCLFDTRVFFGDVPAAEMEEIGDQRLLVTVPPGSGRVDVKVELRFGDPVTLPGGFTYGAAPEAALERVLLPVNFEGPGANGSFWRTLVRTRNDSEVNIPVVPLFWPIPTAPIAGVPFPYIAAHARGFFEGQQRDGGEFVAVPAALEEPLAWAAHISDQSRSTTDLGVEMPIVRVEDTAHTVRLLDVPVESRYRAKLRVYDYDLANGRQVSVVIRNQLGSFLASRELTLTGHSVCVDPGCSLTAAYATLDLDQIPQLRDRNFVDVTVSSRTREGRIWAFVSVTNNETQAVTLYTPQHRTRAQ